MNEQIEDKCLEELKRDMLGLLSTSRLECDTFRMDIASAQRLTHVLENGAFYAVAAEFRVSVLAEVEAWLDGTIIHYDKDGSPLSVDLFNARTLLTEIQKNLERALIELSCWLHNSTCGIANAVAQAQAQARVTLIRDIKNTLLITRSV